jgi:hypothetical protein
VSTNTPHDALFKATFSTPSRAAEELRCVLPVSVSSHLRWEAIRAEPAEFIDENLRGRFADLLFSIPTREGGQALLHLLFEHRSEPDPLMPLRVHIYTARIWERWLRDHPAARKIPPVLTVVLHHGRGGWRAPRELTDIYEVESQLLMAARRHLPSLRLMVDDLSKVSDDALRARAASAMVRLALLVLKHARDSPDMERLLERWRDLAKEVADAAHGFEALAMIVRYLLVVSASASHAGVGEVRLTIGTTADDATVGQQLIEQGIEQGQRKLMLRLLTSRFGDLSAEVVRRVSGANLAQLERWAERILVAETLDAVFDAT